MSPIKRLFKASSKTHELSLVRGALLGPIIIFPAMFLYSVLGYLLEPSTNESLLKVLAGAFIASGYSLFYIYPIVAIYGVPAFLLLKRFNEVSFFTVLLAGLAPGCILIATSAPITQFNWVVLFFSVMIGLSCFMFSIYSAPTPTLPILKGIVLDDSFVLGWNEQDDKVIFDVELSIWPESEFYTEPKSSEYTCYKRAQLIFSNIKHKNSLHPQESVTPFTDANNEKDYGNIEYFDSDGKNFKVYGAFGYIQMTEADFEIKWIDN